MSNVRDVLGATQAVKNLLAKFAVIHDTSLDMRSMSIWLQSEAALAERTPEAGKPRKHKRPESLDHRKHYTRAHYGASVQQIEGILGR